MMQLRRILWVFRELDGDQKTVYLKTLIQRLLGRRRDTLPPLSGTSIKVIFVCHGNIMRSPTAEALFRRHLKNAGNDGLAARTEVSSAGLFARAGRRTDSRALQVAGQLGVSLEEHQASPLSVERVAEAHVIVIMDSLNEAISLSRFPFAAGKVVMLGAFGRLPGESLEIEDPYLGNMETVRACFARVDRAVAAFWGELRRAITAR